MDEEIRDKVDAGLEEYQVVKDGDTSQGVVIGSVKVKIFSDIFIASALIFIAYESLQSNNSVLRYIYLLFMISLYFLLPSNSAVKIVSNSVYILQFYKWKRLTQQNLSSITYRYLPGGHVRGLMISLKGKYLKKQYFVNADAYHAKWCYNRIREILYPEPLEPVLKL